MFSIQTTYTNTRQNLAKLFDRIDFWQARYHY